MTSSTGAPAFTDLTSTSTAPRLRDLQPLHRASAGTTCSSTRPKGHPDIVYTGGSYSYGEMIANKRAVVLSRDAGVSGTDMTFDGTDSLHPNGLHPDQHDLVTNPNNPLQFFETNDGGVDALERRARRSLVLVRRPEPRAVRARLARCQQMLSGIPSKLEGMNHGLSTLQWIKVTASPHNAQLLPGGTQDNGTWETPGTR